MTPFRPGQLVRVFGQWNGVIVKGEAPAGWILVAYQRDDGTKYRAAVPIESIKERA